MSKSIRSAGSAAFAFSLTVGVISLLAAEPAAASDFTVTANSRDQLTEMVPTAGLDLSQAKGVRLLETRIRAASRRVCAVTPVSLAAQSELRCRRTAQDGAAPQVAQLVNRARALASAGQPAAIDTVVAIVAPGGE